MKKKKLQSQANKLFSRHNQKVYNNSIEIYMYINIGKYLKVQPHVNAIFTNGSSYIQSTPNKVVGYWPAPCLLRQ